MSDHLRQRRRRSQLRPQASLQLDEIIDSWGLTQTGDYLISQADIQEFHQLRRLKTTIEKRLKRMKTRFSNLLIDGDAETQPGPLTLEVERWWLQIMSREKLARIVGWDESDRIYGEVPATSHVRLNVLENGKRPR